MSRWTREGQPANKLHGVTARLPCRCACCCCCSEHSTQLRTQAGGLASLATACGNVGERAPARSQQSDEAYPDTTSTAGDNPSMAAVLRVCGWTGASGAVVFRQAEKVRRGSTWAEGACVLPSTLKATSQADYAACCAARQCVVAAASLNRDLVHGAWLPQGAPARGVVCHAWRPGRIRPGDHEC
jgi:hypothetical protein